MIWRYHYFRNHPVAGVFWPERVSGCFFQLPHEMTILPCIAGVSLNFIMVQNCENLRFLQLKNCWTSTLPWNSGVHAVNQIQLNELPEAGADKAQKLIFERFPSDQPTVEQTSGVPLWDPNFAIGCEHTNTWNTTVHCIMTVVTATVVIVTHVSQMFQTVPHHLSFRPLIAGRHGRKWRESLHVIGGLGDLFQRLDRLQLGWRPIWIS